MARLNRALDESPDEPERAEISAELGRYEVAAMRFDAAEEHLRGVVNSGADVELRAQAASMLMNCAVVSGSRGTDAAFGALSSLSEELAPLDAERSLEMGCDLVMLATCIPQLRSGLDAHRRRFRDQAPRAPAFEAVARIHIAQEQLTRGEPAEPIADEVEAAFAVGLPPSRATNAGFLARTYAAGRGALELPVRLLDLGLDGARRLGHAARQGLIHGQRAAIALARGSLHDAQIEAETGLRIVEERHFAFPQLLSVAIAVHIERKELDAAEELVERGGTLDLGLGSDLSRQLPDRPRPAADRAGTDAGGSRRTCSGAGSGWRRGGSTGRRIGSRERRVPWLSLPASTSRPRRLPASI